MHATKRYTTRELNDILRRIAPEVGLWVPQRPATPTDGNAEGGFRVYLRYSDIVAGQPDVLQLYWEGLQKVPVPGALGALSLINGILSERRAGDPEVQRLLNEKFFSNDLRSKVAQFRPGGPAQAVVFNLVGCLVLARHLILYGNDSLKATDQGAETLGELQLLANQFIQPDPEFRSAQPTSLELLLQFIPTWELQNPRDLAYALSRMFTILTDILPGMDPEVRKLAGAIGLDVTTIEIGALALKDFVSAVFGLYAYGNKMPSAGPNYAVFDPGSVFAAVGFPESILGSLIEDRARTIPELRALLAGGRPCTRDGFSEEIRCRPFLTEGLNCFQRFPLLKLDEKRVLILQLQFLVELLTSGVYWSIFDGLPQSRREAFRQLWGRMLELYVTGMLEKFYPAMSRILRVDFGFRTGQVDALLDFADDVFVIETKASLLTERAKRSAEESSFLEDYYLKFVRNEKGKPKALLQLAEACKAVEDGRISTAKKPVRIYPVLVSEDPAVETLFFNTFSNEVFLREASPGPRVQPISVMSVSELEEILPYFAQGALSWTEALQHRFREKDVVPYSVHQSIYDLSKRKGFQASRNPEMRKKFDDVWTVIKSRYKPTVDSEQPRT